MVLKPIKLLRITNDPNSQRIHYPEVCMDTHYSGGGFYRITLFLDSKSLYMTHSDRWGEVHVKFLEHL